MQYAVPSRTRGSTPRENYEERMGAQDEAAAAARALALKASTVANARAPLESESQRVADDWASLQAAQAVPAFKGSATRRQMGEERGRARTSELLGHQDILYRPQGTVYGMRRRG